jgi:two-component system cell cycle sensor histidine kinase/response regulator CckA
VKIGQKLLFGFLVVAMLVGLVGYLGVVSIKCVGKAFEFTKEAEVSSLVATLEMQGAVRQASIKAVGYSLRGKDEDKAKTIEALDKIDAHLYALEKAEELETAKQGEEPEEVPSIRTIRDRVLLNKKELIEYIALKDEGASQEELFTKAEDLHKARKALIHILNTHIDNDKEELKQSLARTKRTIANGVTAITLLSFGNVLLAILMGFFITRSIADPIKKLRDAADKIGKGNLSTRVNVRSRDEIGQLSESLNNMAEDLSRYRDHLEELVEDRTAELTRANEELEREVIERKRADQALRESQERYRALFEYAAEGILVADAHTKELMFGNPAIYQLLGYSEEELRHMTVRDLHPREALEHVASEFEAQARGEKTLAPDIPCLRKDGTRIYADINTASVVIDGRKCNVGFFTDITQRKLTEEAFRESEGRYRAVVEDMPAMICRFLQDGTLTFVNSSYCSYFNKKKEALIGQDFFQFIPKEDQEKVRKHFMSLNQGNSMITYEHQVIAPGRGLRWQEWTDRALFDEQGHVVEYQSIGRDITEEKRARDESAELEARLRHAHKMEAIATLAGGIAHEFNNALVGISGNIELLQIDLPDNKNIEKYVDRIKNAAYRMAGLTNQLLAYARGGKYQPKTISLNDFVEETLHLIQHSINSAIRLETDLPDGISDVEADATQMQMVLSAVLNNASEAIEGKGRIRIITRNERIDEEFVKTHPDLKPGLYACITIEDEGKGMDEQTRDRVFDPFFTTKFQGRGLSMAAVYGIIRNHGGSISVDSALGKGTVVRIYLPAEEVQAEPAEETEAEVTTGSGTLLVIEDEDVVIDVIRPMLERLGYRTLLAKTGKDAVDIAKSFDGAIDLAILDIVLPDMGGREVYPLIMEARPNLKVIVCSGYDIDGPAQEILDAGAQAFIQKPFLLETLSKKLKQVLGGKIGNGYL